MTMNQFMSAMAVLALVGYLALDASTHLTKEAAVETGRRVLAVSVIFAVSVYSLSILYCEISSLAPSFAGPALTATWIVSLFFVLLGAWELYHRALAHSNLGEEAKVSAVDHSLKQLDGILKPLTSAIVAVQASNSEVSRRVDSLEEKVSGLTSATEAHAKAIGAQIQTMASINEKVEFRREQFNVMISGYNKWYEEHRNDADVISKLVSGAENVLEKFGMLSEQVDEYLESIGDRMEESRAGWKNDSHDEEDKTQEGRALATPREPTETGVPPTGGKLTKESGIANREKGNRAQLHFSETVLRDAGKQHRCSLKEGEPDFLFYNPETNLPKSVGAFKAYTLSEAETRQRWIPRRKLLAEIRTAMKLGIPLVLFVQNLVNGRVWAKVITAEEAKKFERITTPLMLIESDPASEKVCRETLEMALKLL